MSIFQKQEAHTDFATLNKLIYGFPKTGKCLQIGTLVMMSDGTSKKVEDIRTGEYVMGLNGKPNLVLNTNKGSGPLYKVTQNKGETYVVNADHILSLSHNKKIRNISVKDFINLPTHEQVRCKGYKSALDLPEQPIDIDPYFLGVWLGDGTSANLNITNPDPEICNPVTDYALSRGLHVKIYNEDKCPTLVIAGERNGGKGNDLLKEFQNHNLLNNKHIPRPYLLNSFEVRSKVLAGLLDTDGYNDANNGVEIVTKYDQLSDDIIWLAKSLGFRATHSIKKGTIKSINFEANYHRIFISGDFTKLPMNMKRKVPNHNNSRDPLITGIQVNRIEDGQWAGFELGNDHLFLLKDFTVTHNSTFASLMKSDDGRTPAFIATEDGHGALAGINKLKVTSWDGFLRLVNAIKADQDKIIKEHSSFVIDLVSDLDEMCAQYVCKQNNVKALGDMEHGKGWFIHKTTFRAAVNELFAILPITFITHSTEKELMWNNEKIKTQTPSLGKQCLEFINGKVDLIMWIAPSNNKKEYPELILKPSTTAIVGSRYPQLAKNFVFKYDKLSETYAQLAKAFCEAPLANNPVKETVV